MSIRQIPFLTAILMLLASSIGLCQTLSPNADTANGPSRYTADLVGRPQSTKPPQAEDARRRSWLHHLVIGGESDDSITKTNASQAVAQPRNGSSNSAAPAAGVGVNPGGQFAMAKQSPASTNPPQAEDARRRSWWRHMVIGGESDDSITKTNASPAPAQQGSNSDWSIAGFVGTAQISRPSVETPPQLVNDTRKADANRAFAHQNSGAFLLENPSSQAQRSIRPESQNPQRDDSIVLTNWLPRISRTPPPNRSMDNPFQPAAPVSAADTDSSATNQLPGPPVAQALAVQGSQSATPVAKPVRLPSLPSPETKPAAEETAQRDTHSVPAVDGNAVPVEANIPSVIFGGGESRRNPLLTPFAPPGPPLAMANPFAPPQHESIQPAQGIATDSMPSFETMESHAVNPLDQSETVWPTNGAVTSSPTAPMHTAESPLGRPKIIFRPVVVGMDSHRNAVLRPDVHLADTAPPPQSFAPQRFAQLPAGEDLPPPTEYVPETDFPVEQEWMPPPAADNGYYTADSDYSAEHVGAMQECWYKLRANLNGPRSCPPGVGVENVMNAPFWIDTTQPLNNCRLRADGAADMQFPDRAEYFWAKTPGGKGPGPDIPFGEPSVDYQDLSFYIERGTKRFSVGTELPIRSVDPQVRLNSTGFGDMNLTTKTLLLDGRSWQLTQIFRTYFPTGSDNRGTGNGHFSMEPGFAYRYKWSDVTYIHGDMKYWFPIAADPDFSGQILNYGIGMSHVLYDSDRWAVMPTFEIKGWTVLDGRQTLPGPVLDPNNAPFDEIDSIGILNVYPGLRIICDKGCDCGVKEFGISTGVTVTEDHWYEEILRLEFRWVH